MWIPRVQSENNDDKGREGCIGIGVESGVEEEGISETTEEGNGEGVARHDVGEVGFDSDRLIEMA